MLVGALLRRLRLERVQDPRATAGGAYGRRGADETGVGEDAQVPADGVRVEADAASEFVRVEPVLRVA
jgi:hypothetical protein